MSKTTKKLCYIALLVAVYVLLSMTFTIKTGNLEITFKSLPVVVAALLFGPAGGGMMALLGEFLCQVMMYGLMPTTILWLLPPVARGLVIGGAARFFWKSGYLLESRPVTCYVVCLVGSFATSCVTTVCLWLDSLIYDYYSFAFVFGSALIRFGKDIVIVAIVTTLDVNIQRTAEDALAEAVEKTKAKNGSALVTDPTTGEILAACSYPTYDQTDLENAKTEDMNLRLVTDAYEPGSVFKTLVAGAGFDLGVVRSSTSFEVPASIKVGDDTVTDADKRDYAMTMDVREMMRRSSNVGFVLVGRKIGADDFAAYVDKWGIGHSSGVDFPGESLGIVKERDQYDGATLGSMSFGQALSVSPIEIARAVGGIANGGVMMTPHFYKSSKGNEKDWGEGERAISEDAASQVTSCMQTVVSEGTGVGGAVDGYDVAGKTGTAERADENGGYLKENYMSSFMGFAPAQSPKVLCYITLDGTPSGSDAAAVPFQSIMANALDVLGIPRTK